jgi:hypothetical protein
VSRWLVGVVGLGAELHQRPHAARGVLLQFECLRKTRGVQALAQGNQLGPVQAKPPGASPNPD